MTDILVVFGTRPEAIKLGPVVEELRALGVDADVLCTGQHTSLLAGTPAETTFADSLSLGLASDGNVAEWVRKAQVALQETFVLSRPLLVVVQGDTMSACAGAEAAVVFGIPVAHVEAGVRSGDLNDPWPEEANRRAITVFAAWHYAPTTTALANLMSEGVPETRIRVTGNTVVSALARYAPDVTFVPQPTNRVLVTLHRREIQHVDLINLLYGALRVQALKYPHIDFVWPLHPAVEKLLERLTEPPNLHLCQAMAYEPFTRMLAESRGVLTDSGGLVEEAATLGVPTAILRNVNDRPEAEEAGIARRFAPTAEGLAQAVKWVTAIDTVRLPTSVFGQPEAAAEIAEHLAQVTMRMRHTTFVEEGA